MTSSRIRLSSAVSPFSHPKILLLSRLSVFHPSTGGKKKIHRIKAKKRIRPIRRKGFPEGRARINESLPE
jgi:hypothetical protein